MSTTNWSIDGTTQQTVVNFQHRETYETVISVVFLLFIMLTALVGNTAVIAVICKQHTMRREVSNLLIVNLSITDLSNTLLVMMSALIALVTDGWPLGKFWCDCTCMINYCLIIVSMLTLCCISIDRYQAVMHPLSYSLRITRKRLTAIICYTWLQGLIFGLIPSVLNWVDFDYWEAICAIQWHLYRPSSIIYVVCAFIMCFLGPGIILIYCYTFIISEVKKQKSHVVVQTTNKKYENKKRVSDRVKITWSLITVVLAYFICTTPFSVTKLIKVSAHDTNVVPGQINLTASLLGYVASAINPLIYGIFRKDFRKAYIHLLRSVFGCKEMKQITTTSENYSQTNWVTQSNATVGNESGKQLQGNCVQNTTKTNDANTRDEEVMRHQESMDNHETTDGTITRGKMTRIATITDQFKSNDKLLQDMEMVNCDHLNFDNHDNVLKSESESPVSCKQVCVKSASLENSIE